LESALGSERRGGEREPCVCRGGDVVNPWMWVGNRISEERRGRGEVGRSHKPWASVVRAVAR